MQSLKRRKPSGNSPQRFLGFQFHYIPIHDEFAEAPMVEGLRILLSRVNPGFQRLQNEETEFIHEARVDDLAFEIGETFGHQGGRDALRIDGRQPKRLELINVTTRAIADFDNF